MLRWLEKEASVTELILYVVICVELSILTSLFGSMLAFGLGLNPTGSGVADTSGLSPASLVFVLTVAALVEEFIFRFPLAVLGQLEVSHKRILVVAVCLSCFFGWLHGGAGHIFIQGGTGFLLSLVFLKCGGFQGRAFKAMTASTAAHFLFNVSVGVVFP